MSVTVRAICLRHQIRAVFCGMRTLVQQDPAAICLLSTANMRCMDYILRHPRSCDLPSVELGKFLFAMLENGKLDGSIRRDLDTRMAVELITTGFSGLMQRIAAIFAAEPGPAEKGEAALIYKEFLTMLERCVTPKR